MTHTTIEAQEQERAAPSAAPVRFQFGTRSVLIIRAVAGVLAVPFIGTLVTRTSGLPGLLALIAAAVGGLVLYWSERKASMRPGSVIVDAAGLSVSGHRVLPWADIAIVHYNRLLGLVTFGTRSNPEALAIDAGLDDLGGFLDLATQHIDASRRTEEIAKSRTRGDGLFRRSMIPDIAAFAMVVIGVILGLMIRPMMFGIAIVALPVLLWHWLRVPHSVAVDDMAIWIVRPFNRDVIPHRAVRDIELTVAGRLVSPVVVIHHADRGAIVVSELGAAILPLLDGIIASRLNARAAVRTGPSATRRGSAIRYTSTRRSMLALVGVIMAAAAVGSWVTVLTGLPLRAAAKHGNTTVVSLALFVGSPLETKGPDGLTALHHAADRNDITNVSSLLDNGADADAVTSPQRLTALHMAAARGHRNVIELLINANADVNAQNADGRTPLAQSALPGSAGDTAIARMLIAAGGDPNISDNDGRTALHHAAMSGHADLIRRIVRSGGNIERRDLSGNRPLHAAVLGQQQQAVAALISVRADVNAQGAEGRTALAHAVAAGAPAGIIADLLDARADVTRAGPDGWNAVQLATRANNVPVLEVFSRRRLPLNATSGNVPPALYIAAENNRLDAARVLMRGGASPYVRWNGRSPIEVARMKRNGALVALMQIR